MLLITLDRPLVVGTLLVLLISAHVSPVGAVELDNAGFEVEFSQTDDQSGWEIVTYGQDVERDFDMRTEGLASLRVSAPSLNSSTMLRQQFQAEMVRSGAIRLFGKIRSVRLQGTATLFVVVNDSSTRIFVDDMRGRPIQGDSEWMEVEIRVPRMLDAKTIEIGVLMIGSGTAWFDDLGVEQVEIKDRTSDAAANYLQIVVDIMEERSIHSSGANWAALREDARITADGSQTPTDIYPTVRYILRKLGDRHSSLFTPVRAQQVTNEGADSTRLPKWESPTRSVVEERLAYMSIPKFSGTNPQRMTEYADELQASIRELDSENICGWIVDLRENLGGNVFPMLAGIGPILGEGDAGGGRAADGTEVMRSYLAGKSGKATVSGDAYKLLDPMPPVAVLIGPNTASSGEAVALAFIGRPRTKTFGSTTAGYTTGNVPIPLSDGAILNLAVSQMMDRNRNVYDGPIAPDVLVKIEKDARPELDLVVESAVAWLKGRKSCANED